MRIVLVVIFLAGLSVRAGGQDQAAPPLQPSQTEDQLTRALEQMHGWLAEHGDNGTAWVKHLQSKTLLAELAQRRNVNVDELDRILKLFQGQAEGLDDPHFVEVRDALQQHIAAARSFQDRIDELKYETPKFDGSVVETRKQRFDRALSRVRVDVAQLDQYLRNSGAQNESEWKKILEWDALQAELAKDRPSPGKLMQLRENFYGKAAGLGTTPFRRVRDSLSDYSYASVVASAPPQVVERWFQGYMDQLNKSALDYAWDYDESPAIAMTLFRLEKLTQAKGLVAEVRRQHAIPNTRVRIAEAMAGSGINDAIDNVSPITDYMMKTSIRGTVHTTGGFYLGLAPSPRGVSLAICVDAQGAATTTGTRGKVRVHSSANTTVKASKAMFFTEEGHLSAQPATAKCDTSSTITGVEARLGIVRRIARKKAYQYKSFGESVANQKGQKRAAEELDKQAEPLLDKANTAYRDKVRRPLHGLDVYPNWHNFASSFDAVSASFRVAGDHQLAATTPPPPMPTGYAAAAQVHESAVSNLADTLIRAYVLDNENSVQMLKDLKQPVPKELEEDEEWSVRFSKINCVNAKFRNNRVRLAFRGDYFTQGTRTPIDYEMEFFAVYEPVVEPRRLVLKRIGDVDARIVDSEKGLTVSQIAVREVIASKFDAVFKKELEIKSRMLPEPYDKAGDILPALVVADNGWLTLAVNAANVR